MASTGDFSLGGNQIYVSLQKGKQWPPTTIDIRVKYEETIADLKRKVEKELGVPPEKQQLFHHGNEMVDRIYSDMTLEQLNLHTGFQLKGYDLTEEPDYWPPVEETPKGLRIKKMEPPAKLKGREDMGYEDGLTVSEAIQKYRTPGSRW